MARRPHAHPMRDGGGTGRAAAADVVDVTPTGGMHAAGVVADDVVASPDGSACCSVWYRHAPTHRGRKTGFIGALDAPDLADAAPLLALACDRLRAAGCALAVGPVDGDTWHRYRLVVEDDGSPPFALEPWSPPGAHAPWLRAGFTALETYASLHDDALGERDARAAALAARFRAHGVTFRDLDVGRYGDELRAIHALALRGFRDAPLFTPIAFDAFAALYAPLRPLLEPTLCPLAECDGRTAGAVFALRDPRRPGCVVFKTIVRDPDRRFAGLGIVLADAARAAAHALGATHAVSALMHDDARSHGLAPRARAFRRYAVFGKELT